MLKRVLYDYIRSFHWKNIVQVIWERETNNFSVVWTICYFCILRPLTTRLYEETIFAIASYYLWVIPFIIGILGIQFLPIRLTKLVFLCPMDMQERRQYSYAIFWGRILIPVTIEAVLGMFLSVCGIMNLIVVFIYGFSLMSFFIMTSTKVYGTGKPMEKESEQQYFNLKYFLCIMFCAIAQMGNIMFIEELLNGGRIYHYVLFTEMIIFLLIDVFCLRSLPELIEKSITYEERFKTAKQTTN